MITPYVPKAYVEPYYPTVLDLESNQSIVDGIGFAWSEGDVREYRQFANFEEFFPFYTQLLDSRPDLRPRLRRIYAHNGSGFDWLFLLDYCLRADLVASFELIVTEQSPVGARLLIKGLERIGYIHLRDSYRLLPSSLHSLCRSFDVSYAKLKIDVLPHVLKRENPDLFWEYLRRDVLALQEVLYRFWSFIFEHAGNIGELPLTAPSLAMRLWRMRLVKPIMTTWNEKVKSLERSSYVGGRTECFRTGVVDRINVYDYNSIYPYAMLSGHFPISYRGYWTSRFDPSALGIYKIVYVQSNEHAKPVLRDAVSGKYAYRGTGVYCTPEILKLLEVGGSISVIQGWVYIDVGNPFREYVTHWWTIRKQARESGDKALDYVSKILLVSLYGKFGQREERHVVKLLKAEEQRRLIKERRVVAILGEFSVVREPSRNEYTFCAIASYVTSYARVRLYEAIAHGDVWYCDTDSIHTTGELPVGTDLGDLKLEYTGPAAYAGRKLYALKDLNKVKAKGVRASIMTDFGPQDTVGYNDIVRIAVDPSARVPVWYSSLPTWREVISGQVEPGVTVYRSRTLRQTG